MKQHLAAKAATLYKTLPLLTGNCTTSARSFPKDPRLLREINAIWLPRNRLKLSGRKWKNRGIHSFQFLLPPIRG